MKKRLVIWAEWDGEDIETLQERLAMAVGERVRQIGSPYPSVAMSSYQHLFGFRDLDEGSMCDHSIARSMAEKAYPPQTIVEKAWLEQRASWLIESARDEHERASECNAAQDAFRAADEAYRESQKRLESARNYRREQFEALVALAEPRDLKRTERAGCATPNARAEQPGPGTEGGTDGE